MRRLTVGDGRRSGWRSGRRAPWRPEGRRERRPRKIRFAVKPPYGPSREGETEELDGEAAVPGLGRAGEEAPMTGAGSRSGRTGVGGLRMGRLCKARD
jgi:hypothetical protein